jgi:hypothetical protein
MICPSMFCPWGHFVPVDVLSLVCFVPKMFFPWMFSLRTFFLRTGILHASQGDYLNWVGLGMLKKGDVDDDADDDD